MNSLTVGSLFSGVGGLDLGLERAGMQVSWQVEKDEYANKVLAKHWPNVIRHRDIYDVGAHNLEPVDVLCGGFPCQDVSLAGKRAGLDGKRSTLWGEFARIIRELRPRWVLAENVPGLLSANDGRFFGRVLGDLAACGYDAEWDVLSAAALGAPHRRERVAIVAYPAGSGAQPAQQQRQRDGSLAGGKDVPNSDAQLFYGRRRTRYRRPKPANGDWWATEPDVGRVAHGVPARVDRLRCLGNAVVPQWAEWIGAHIVESDKGQ